jgi:thiol-disulfide isomerase/thioredoxin
MKKILLLASFSIIFIFSYTYIRKQGVILNKESFEINHKDFKKYIKERPYTILYFWASWCGFSQSGLLNDYNKNYKYINNDTVQSLLIVASDTNSINGFMKENNIKLPYKCLNEGSYSILNRNLKDGKNMLTFIKDIFNYNLDSPKFPTVLLVDSSFNVITNSSQIKYAISNYRYDYKKRITNSK